ncbi:cellulase family glycosylhydrolase [bacterium]|nr:cellulase family glycosylhydrolase [bacterium]
MKKIWLITAFLFIVNAARPAVFEVGTALADSTAPDTTGMGTWTSVELAKKMIPGWNLGNTLEALPTETSWGNPLTTRSFMDAVKEAGFNSVRIPVAWSKFTGDPSDYTIDPAWLNRVEEVVDYALDNDMFVIINEHWDNGWQVPTYADSAAVSQRLAAMWKQIAIHFRDFDHHLLFAGTNEIHVPDQWGAPTLENIAVQNSFNQTFVRTVRSTGGCNYYRYLAVQGYVTNIDYTVRYFVAPADPVPDRLFVEVHYYDPYNFTLNSDDRITQWGMYATDPSRTETWANESYANSQFRKMKTNFVDNGFGVILGEYCATNRTNLGSPERNEEYARYRLYYTQYITRAMVRQDLVPYYWDAGYYGNHGSGLFNRSTGEIVDPDILDAVVDTSIVDPVTGMDRSSRIPAGFFLGQNYPNPFNPSTHIGYHLPAKSQVVLKVFDTIGREIAMLVNERQTAGDHSVRFDAHNCPGGVYLYRIEAGGYRDTRKLVLLK